MNHPWPPNDAERADWDRRAKAYQQRIDTLTNELAAARAETLTAQQALDVRTDEAEAAQARAEAEAARASELRLVVEFYAAAFDGGERARAAL